jgi:predicted glycosyltransferase
VLRNRIYYTLKPFIPQPLRAAVRRRFALRLRDRVRNTWPIMPGSERPPDGWKGWPNDKKFALVLTHDVESQVGLDRVRRLAELEIKVGVRSCFNFIPEGSYRVSKSLLDWLVSNGFEVGVHDLHHDGRLYRHRRDFIRKSERINHYLKEWGATGFRSGFMLNKLDWLHDLDVRYDASTFDTDPFEPQPDAVDTIFPFWVPAPQSANAHQSTRRRDRDGYVELPYTLPQDSTLFLLLREPTPAIWIQKLDWIARHGGMALVDTHPDYMAMDPTSRKTGEYPVAHYEELLRYLRSTYSQSYWHVLPCEIADWVHRSKSAQLSPTLFLRRPSRKPKIWIDLDNTPHVPFFEPILDELKARGFPLLVTARDAFQVCELADKKGLSYIKVGRHHGKNRALKAAGLVYRALQLSPVEFREKPELALSHGARSQLLLSNWLRIPTILIEDYEYSQFTRMMRPTWIMAPDMIPDDALCGSNGQIRKYSGIKEDVYVWKLVPDPSLLRELGLADSDLIVTVRPPATEAHYHNPKSEKLFERFMARASSTPGVRIVLLPRNQKQGELIRHDWPAWFENQKTVIPSAALDGLNLLWHSDLVVSGGGTMNREAAALGVPVYSIFRGTIGAVDRHLSREGRLALMETVEDVDTRIPIVKRPRRAIGEATSKRTLQQIVDSIEEIAEFHRPTH